MPKRRVRSGKPTASTSSASDNAPTVKPKKRKVSRKTIISKRSGKKIKTPECMPNMPVPEMSFEDFKVITERAIKDECDDHKVVMEAVRRNLLKCNYYEESVEFYQRRYYDYLYQRQLESSNPVVCTVNDYFNESGSSGIVEKRPDNVDVTHIHWCAICGKLETSGNPLEKCATCCISFHKNCHETRLRYFSHEDDHDKYDPCVAELKKRCIKCLWGRTLGTGDMVWHKMKNFPWWPAKIVPYDMKPRGLKNPPGPKHVLLFYYSSKNYAWAHIRQICSFNIDYAPLKMLANVNLQLAIQEARSELSVDHCSSL